MSVSGKPLCTSVPKVDVLSDGGGDGNKRREVLHRRMLSSIFFFNGIGLDPVLVLLFSPLLLFQERVHGRATRRKISWAKAVVG